MDIYFAAQIARTLEKMERNQRTHNVLLASLIATIGKPQTVDEVLKHAQESIAKIKET